MLHVSYFWGKDVISQIHFTYEKLFVLLSTKEKYLYTQSIMWLKKNNLMFLHFFHDLKRTIWIYFNINFIYLLMSKTIRYYFLILQFSQNNKCTIAITIKWETVLLKLKIRVTMKNSFLKYFFSNVYRNFCIETGIWYISVIMYWSKNWFDPKIAGSYVLSDEYVDCTCSCDFLINRIGLHNTYNKKDLRML